MKKLLPIIQADRDAVQDFHRAMFDGLRQAVQDSAAGERFGEDRGDAGTLVQAFAQARLAHSAVLVAENERLREAAIRGALCLSGFAGEGICIDGHEDSTDAWTRIAEAVGLHDGDDDDLRTALETRNG